MALYPISPDDQPLLREIYVDAVESQASELYSLEQVRAWASLARLPGLLDRTFSEGCGWISGDGAAFAMRCPMDRLALLYCRGRAARQGHATALLNRLEEEAFTDGCTRITTEASLLSRPLLHRRGWRLIAPETIAIAGVPFERYRMERLLRQEQS